jgi:hypothetical protein
MEPFDLQRFTQHGIKEGQYICTFKVQMFEGSEETLEFTSQFFFNDTISDQVHVALTQATSIQCEEKYGNK